MRIKSLIAGLVCGSIFGVTIVVGYSALFPGSSNSQPLEKIAAKDMALPKENSEHQPGGDLSADSNETEKTDSALPNEGEVNNRASPESDLERENEDLKRELAEAKRSASPARKPKTVKPSSTVRILTPAEVAARQAENQRQLQEQERKANAQAAKKEANRRTVETRDVIREPALLLGNVQPQNISKKLASYEVYPGVDYETEQGYPKGFGDGKGVYLIVARQGKSSLISFRTSRMKDPVRIERGEYIYIQGSRGDARILRYNGLLIKNNLPERPFASFDIFDIENENRADSQAE